MSFNTTECSILKGSVSTRPEVNSAPGSTRPGVISERFIVTYMVCTYIIFQTKSSDSTGMAPLKDKEEATGTARIPRLQF